MICALASERAEDLVLVRELIEQGQDAEELCSLLGMEDEEVNRLAERAGLPEVVTRAHGEFSKGWIPG